MRSPSGKLVLMFLLSIGFFNVIIHAQKAELVVQTGHFIGVNSVTFSFDGQLIASKDFDGITKIWDSASGKEIRTFKRTAGELVVFLPDGKRIASGNKIWDVETGNEVAISGQDEINLYASSLDGKTIASVIVKDGASNGEKIIELWELTSGRKLISLFSGHTSAEINTISFSPDGKTIASGSGDTWGMSGEITDNTIKIWSTQTGKLIRTLTGHSRSVESIAFSPDGKFIVSGSMGDTIKLWNAETGVEVRTFQGGDDSVAFSPDGKFIVSGGRDIKLWSVDTGKVVRTFTYSLSWANSVAFSPNGNFIVAGYGDSNVKLWDVETGEEVKSMTGRPFPIRSVAFSPNGKQIITDVDSTIQLWDAEPGKEIKTLQGGNNPVVFSPNGKLIASGSRDKVIRIWDAESGEEIRTLPNCFKQRNNSNNRPKFGRQTNSNTIVNSSPLQQANSSTNTNLTGNNSKSNLSSDCKGLGGWGVSIAFSPDGKHLVSGSSDSTIKIWDVENGNEIRTLKGHIDGIRSIAFSPNGKQIVSGGGIGDYTIKIWDVESGNVAASWFMDNPIDAVAFSPDGKHIIFGISLNNIFQIGNKQNQYVECYSGSYNSSIPFSSDKKLVARGCRNVVKIWDVESGKEVKTFQGHTGQVNSVSFSPDGRFIVSGSDDAKTKIWDISTGKVIANLIAVDQNDWVVATPDGLFDASVGARKFMHYVIGLEPITLEQMKDVYYVPGLLQKIFKGDPLPRVELFSKKDLFPSVEYEPLKPKQKQLKIKLTNRGGGIGQVQVLVNGKELIPDARPKKFNPNSAQAVLTVDLSKAAIKTGEENKVEIVARNAAGSLNSRGARGTDIIYQDDSQKQTETPNIYVIAGGVSDYTGDDLKLKFAAKDAEDFARALELGASKLLGDKSKVHIRLLTSNGDKSGVKFDVPDARISTATKADFERAFNDFRSATPNDVFIVYLSGHGVSLNLNQNRAQAGGDTYLYLTQEATTTDTTKLVLENTRKAMAISSDELKDLMKQNKALKQVLILDTCAAGQIAPSLVGKRDLPSDQIRAIERLKDNTGFFVLMGSAADSVSYEASQYGQGLLTYSLLQGMQGARLRENQFADIGLLFDYAQEKVPQMAKNIGGIQQPRIIMPDASRSFDIGKFTSDEQKLIRLSTPKPIILRPSLRNSALRFDNLRLTQMLIEQLREISYVQTRDEPSRIVFVEADEMTDAILPVGDYTVEGDILKISVILVKNNAPQDKEISVLGNVSEKEKLIKQLVVAIIQEAK